MWLQHWPYGLVLIGTVLAAVGAFAGAFTSASRQSRYQESLNAKNEEIIRLQTDVYNEMTGGDSFVYVLPISGGMTIIPKGKYPVYDVVIDWVDVTNFKPPGSLQEALAQRHYIDVGNIYPHATKYIPNGILLTSLGEKRVNIFFTARNGYWRQVLVMVQSDRGVAVATQVTRGFGNESVIYEKVDDGFSRDTRDIVGWNSGSSTEEGKTLKQDAE